MMEFDKFIAVIKKYALIRNNIPEADVLEADVLEADILEADVLKTDAPETNVLPKTLNKSFIIYDKPVKILIV
jgi:hypothetical protein